MKWLMVFTKAVLVRNNPTTCDTDETSLYFSSSNPDFTIQITPDIVDSFVYETYSTCK